MSTLSSSHCSASYSSTSNACRQRSTKLPSIPKRFVPVKSAKNSYQNVVLLQDGAVSSTMTPIENESTLKKLKDGLLTATSLEE